MLPQGWGTRNPNRQGGSATLHRVSDTELRITDKESALTLTVRANLEGHTIHYDYSSNNSRVASPEGGILSIRRSRWGRPELYSADQLIYGDGSRRVLLEPIICSRRKRHKKRTNEKSENRENAKTKIEDRALHREPPRRGRALQVDLSEVDLFQR